MIYLNMDFYSYSYSKLMARPSCSLLSQTSLRFWASSSAPLSKFITLSSCWRVQMKSRHLEATAAPSNNMFESCSCLHRCVQQTDKWLSQSLVSFMTDIENQPIQQTLKADKYLMSPLLPLCTRSKLGLIFSFETDRLIHIRLWEGWLHYTEAP